MKAQELFEKSYFDIGKLAEEQDITSAMDRAAILALNDLMFENADLGLGYTVSSSSADEITTPNWSWRWMRYALAAELFDQYGVIESSDSIRTKRDDAYRSVIAATINPNYVYDDGAVTTEQQNLIVTEGA